MPKSIYQNQLDKLLIQLEQEEKKPSLLLHACCGPCSSYVLEYLASRFDITIYYYNPNIYPQEEYERRRDELINLLPRFSPAIENKVKFVRADYNPEEFYQAVDITHQPELATEPEKGERCRRCYQLRLTKSYQYATENHFDYFCTTLSISPFKDAQKINQIGQELADTGRVTAVNESFTSPTQALAVNTTPASSNSPLWLPSDFKKKSGFLRSLQLSEEYNLYRQQYCGCIFSKNNTKHV